MAVSLQTQIKKIVMSQKQNISEEELKDNQAEMNENMDAETAADQVEEQEKVEEPSLEDELKEANEKFIRLYAEFENFRKRTNKEKVDLLSHASAGVLKDLLPVMDDFDRAIENNKDITDENVLKEGFQLIYSKFRGIMETKGVKEMITKGEVFDSEIHEAIANVPAPEEALKGKIVDNIEKGYYLNDRVIRFAKVVVGQ